MSHYLAWGSGVCIATAAGIAEAMPVHASVLVGLSLALAVMTRYARGL